MMLDDAYANAAYIDGADGFPPRWEKEAEAFRASLGARAQLNVRYGPSDRQKFDFFQPEGVSRGTAVFVHGGYWKAFDKSYWSHLAAGPLARGYAVAVPSYDLCPDVRISEISTQIAAALTEVANRTQGTIVLSGHSAGGHLVARMTDPLLLGAEVRDRITRIVPISPVADLAPLLQTEMNDILRLDEAEAAAESPIKMTPPHGVDVTVWVGAAERPVFLDQARRLGNAWACPVTVERDRHHFDVIEGLERESPLLATLLG